MKFSYTWIQELSGVTLPIQEAAELLTAKAFETVISDTPGVLDIDILPNRPDALSHLGVARELAALTGTRFSVPAYEWTVHDEPSKPVVLHDAACVRYSGLVVRGLRVGPSPQWLRERLELCGLKSINNVVDVTNYVMLELGQPMHAFDNQKIKRIDVRRATDGDVLVALDDARTNCSLDDSMLIIAHDTTPLALAGIKGGVGTGITDETTDVFLEAANFLPEAVRATSRKLNLRTDASIRFSYGVDPALTAPALIRAAELLARVAGGKSSASIIDVYPTARHEVTMALDPAYVRDLLGLDIQSAQIKGILESLGFEASVMQDGILQVTVPTRRSDIIGPEDLVEEVGRVYGFDAIASQPPLLPIYSEHSWVREDTAVAWDEYGFIRQRQAIGQLLAGAGYSEVYNYAFLSDEIVSLLQLKDLHELAQPQSSDYRWLRSSLIPRLLVNARDNLRFADQVHLFETGHVFSTIGQGKEPSRLGLVIARRDETQDLFFELKGAVSMLVERLGLSDVYFDDAQPFPWDAGAVQATLDGQRAIIHDSNDAIIGFIGVVHGRVASDLKLKGGAVIAELDLRALIETAEREREFEPLPKYPDVIRDVAILVPRDTKIDAILEVVQEADTHSLVRDVDVFDIFVPTRKERASGSDESATAEKSVAFHVLLRSDERTLTDRDVEEAMSMIQRALQERLGATIR